MIADIAVSWYAYSEPQEPAGNGSSNPVPNAKGRACAADTAEGAVSAGVVWQSANAVSH